VKSDAVVFKNYAWNGEAKGRYIRYQARAGEEFGGWVFTDEIVVE
jgi:hexosaminidase